MRDRLVGLGVIHCDYLFDRGKRAYGYRLQPDYRKTHRIVCQNAALSRKIQSVCSEEEVTPGPVHLWLEEAFERLAWDMNAMTRLAARAVPDDGTDTEEYRQRLRGAVQRIANGDLWATVDRFGRFHTPLTSLPKQWRSLVTCDGVPLVGLDLANSQPLIAGLAARQFYASKWSKHRLLQRTFAQQADPYRYGVRPADGRVDGVERYIELCERGQFYESLMQPGDDRDTFKVRLYSAVFFGENKWKGPLKTRFEQAHPEIAAMLRTMKAKDYRRSAWLLQNYEATLFIGAIAARIRDERPDLPLYTIHDAMLTTAQHLPYVAAVVREEFARLDCHPTLKDLDGGPL
ncbi:MAG: hypothetical protein KY475_07975 [Planctomycetes bacterium]|nr:hypothetical protein [Planctomycetota bacterium]